MHATMASSNTSNDSNKENRLLSNQDRSLHGHVATHAATEYLRTISNVWLGIASHPVPPSGRGWKKLANTVRLGANLSIAQCDTIAESSAAIAKNDKITNTQYAYSRVKKGTSVGAYSKSDAIRKFDVMLQDQKKAAKNKKKKLQSNETSSTNDTDMIQAEDGDIDKMVALDILKPLPQQLKNCSKISRNLTKLGTCLTNRLIVDSVKFFVEKNCSNVT